MSTHTPGPWSVFDDEIVGAGTEEHIATVELWDGIHPAEWQANARLIAAAASGSAPSVQGRAGGINLRAVPDGRLYPGRDCESDRLRTRRRRFFALAVSELMSEAPATAVAGPGGRGWTVQRR